MKKKVQYLKGLFIISLLCVFPLTVRSQYVDTTKFAIGIKVESYSLHYTPIFSQGIFLKWSNFDLFAGFSEVSNYLYNYHSGNPLLFGGAFALSYNVRINSRNFICPFISDNMYWHRFSNSNLGNQPLNGIQKFRTDGFAYGLKYERLIFKKKAAFQVGIIYLVFQQKDFYTTYQNTELSGGGFGISFGLKIYIPNIFK